MPLRNLQTRDIDLNGYGIASYAFNVVATGQLPTNGSTNIIPLLPAMITKALGSGSECVLDFPPGRYLIGTTYAFPSSVVVRVQRGAHFIVPAAVTFTIPVLEAGIHQIFEADPACNIQIRQAHTLYPQWFGAKGDGVSDDTLALQKAFDTLTVAWVPGGTYTTGYQSPGKLTFPAGIYNITNTLTLKQSFGQIISGNTAACASIAWSGPSGVPQILWLNARTVTLENIYIKGNSNPSNIPSIQLEVRGGQYRS